MRPVGPGPVGKRILVICSDRVGPQMAGTGIRAFRLAEALSRVGAVTLAALEGSSSPDGSMPVVEYSVPEPAALKDLIREAHVVVAQPNWPTTMEWLRRSGARVIFDLYAPEVLEALESYTGHRPAVRRLLRGVITDRLVHALHIGHHFLCASERQRDLWTGVILGERLLSDRAYQSDPALSERFAIVPFGIDDAPPSGDPRTGIYARFPAIAHDDEVILWNGGLWGWFDPLTAVRAFAALHERRPSAKLVFMGAAKDAETAGGGAQAETVTAASIDLARRLSLLDTAVFFNDRWVPFQERSAWLNGAQCAVSTHVEHLETRYSFRTRLLDCFWAGLPVVCTEGDSLADLVERNRLGATVPPSDHEALADRLEQVLEAGKESYSDRLAATADRFRWSVVTRPLLDQVCAPELPEPLGAGLEGAWAMRIGQRVRTVGYRASRATLNAVGLRDWPTIAPIQDPPAPTEAESAESGGS